MKPIYQQELTYIKEFFAGNVFDNIESLKSHQLAPNALIYLCGNISQISQQFSFPQSNKQSTIDGFRSVRAHTVWRLA